MPSSNPAFGRGFARAMSGQGYPGTGSAGWGPAPQGYGAPADPYAAPAPYARSTARYMTMDDVVTRTGLTLLVTVLAGAGVWALPGTTGWAIAGPAALVAFVLGLVMSFRVIANPVATLVYAAAQGAALGAVSELYNDRWNGIVTQAIIATIGVFAGMLVVYKTGAIRVTPRFTRWLLAAAIGAVVLMLANFVAYIWLPGGLGLRSGGALSIVFSLVVIAVGAMMLLQDFAMVDDAIRRGQPTRFAWYLSFALLLTIIWLYLEILRLISYLRE